MTENDNGGRDCCTRAVRKIPIERFLERLDDCFAHNDLPGAGRLIDFWYAEAEQIDDRRGRLSVLNEMLGFYRRTNDREKGLWAVQQSVTQVESLGLSESVSGATILLNAATTLKAFDQPKEALPLYESVGTVYRRYLKPDDSLMGGYYNNYALTLCDLGRFEEALSFYQQALEIMQQTPAGLADCAVTYVNAAHLYEAWKGSLAPEIVEMLTKADACLEDERLPRNSYYAFVCTKCAPSFDYFGFFVRAKELTERAASIYAGA